MELSKKTCVPCEKGMPRLEADQVRKLAGAVEGWRVAPDGSKIEKQFRFDDFKAALAFINVMGALAEREQHHPDFCLHYNVLDVTLQTHAANGLSENDFILAAKIDEL